MYVYKLSLIYVGNSKPTGGPASTDGRTGAAETGNPAQVFPWGGGPSTANAGTTARGLDPDQRTVQHLPQVRQPCWCWVQMYDYIVHFLSVHRELIVAGNYSLYSLQNIYC